MRINYRKMLVGQVVLRYRKMGRLRKPPLLTERCKLCGDTGVVVGRDDGSVVLGHVVDQHRSVLTPIEWCALLDQPAASG